MFSVENLLYLGANLFRVYVMYRFARAFLGNLLTSKKLEILMFLLYFVLNSFAHIFVANLFVNLATNVLPLFAITFLYKSKVYVKFLSTALVCAINLFLDVIVFMIFSSFHIVNVIFVGNLASALAFLLIELAFEHFSKFKGSLLLSVSHLISIIFIPVGSVVIATLTMSEAKPYILAIAFVLIAINVLIFFLYDALGRAYEEKHNKIFLEQQSVSYANQLALMSESQNALKFFRHDMSKHFQEMNNLLLEKNYSGLSTYLGDCNEYIKKTRAYSESGNGDIDSMLNYKLREIDSRGIDIKVNISLPDKMFVRVFDLNIILGNLVDNAIEALYKCEGGELFIEIKHKKGLLFITIENTCTDKIEFKDGKPITTKPDLENHGLGLRSIQHTLDKYNGVMTISQKNNLFTVEALLYDS